MNSDFLPYLTARTTTVGLSNNGDDGCSWFVPNYKVSNSGIC